MPRTALLQGPAATTSLRQRYATSPATTSTSPPTLRTDVTGAPSRSVAPCSRAMRWWAALARAAMAIPPSSWKMPWQSSVMANWGNRRRISGASRCSNATCSAVRLAR